MTFEELLNEHLFYIGLRSTNKAPSLLYYEFFSIYTSLELAEEDLENYGAYHEIFEVKNNKAFFDIVAKKGRLRYVINGEGIVYDIPLPEGQTSDENASPGKVSKDNLNPAASSVKSGFVTSTPEQNPPIPKQTSPQPVTVAEKNVSQNATTKSNRPIIAAFHFVLAGFVVFLLLGGYLNRDIAVVSFIPMFVLHLLFGVLCLKKYLKAPIASFIFPFFIAMYISFRIKDPTPEDISILQIAIIMIAYFIFRNRNIFKKQNATPENTI